MKRVAIIQSSYIPWKGYFDIIHDVDEFIFLDDVQFTIRDWRTRNRIKTANGPLWLSIPAGTNRHRNVCDVVLGDHAWQSKHWESIRHAYAKAPFFHEYETFFTDLYLGKAWQSLSELNQTLTTRIARDLLGIRTRFTDSRQYAAEGTRTNRLIDLIIKSGGTHYISGPTARAYLDATAFTRQGLALEYKDYSDYPEYPQSHPPFEHAVSILDLLFNTGSASSGFIWGHRENKT